MEKLIELLNEYSKNIWYFNKEDLQWQTKAWILSKEFWWIWWLVENDKIDIDKLEKKVLKENLIRKFDEWLLMLLSISNSPLEDLILYLK
jgi:hypothetical protein